MSETKDPNSYTDDESDTDQLITIIFMDGTEGTYRREVLQRMKFFKNLFDGDPDVFKVEMRSFEKKMFHKILNYVNLGLITDVNTVGELEHFRVAFRFFLLYDPPSESYDKKYKEVTASLRMLSTLVKKQEEQLKYARKISGKQCVGIGCNDLFDEVKIPVKKTCFSCKQSVCADCEDDGCTCIGDENNDGCNKYYCSRCMDNVGLNPYADAFTHKCKTTCSDCLKNN